MSSEVCPFCGKTYKRLKSHLPHCKAAASSKTPPTKHDITVTKTASSPRLAAALTEPTAAQEKPTQTLMRKSKKVSVPSGPLESSSPTDRSSSSQSLSLSSPSPPLSTKKKKQQLSEQIKTATMASSTNMSLISTPSQSPSLSPAKPKKKSLRASIEVAKAEQISKRSLKGTRSTSEDLPTGSASFVADPLSSRTTIQTETKTNPHKDLVKSNAHPALLSTENKPKGATKVRVSKTKKAAQSLSKNKDTSSSLVSKVSEISARPHVRNVFVMDNEGEIEGLSANKMFLETGSSNQARITLQDVKSTLGRTNTTRHSVRPSILSQIETTDDLSSKIRPGTGLSPEKDIDSCLVTTKTTSDHLPSISSQHTELQSFKGKSSKSKQASLMPLQHHGSPHSELTSPATPLLPGHLLSQMSQTKSGPHTVSLNEKLKVGHQMTGLPTSSLTQYSSPNLFPLAPQTLPTRVEETLGTVNGSTKEKSQLGFRIQSTAENGTRGAATQRSLGQVTLRELPDWLACRTPSHPRDVVNMVQRGWQWYYKRYIDVKKGGVGGLSMLLVGYCVLSYIWRYPQIKRDRWRKYH